jgi:hypothetical protein
LEKGLMDRSGHHISWQPAGRVTLCERGGPLFPDIEPVPGLFRLDFPDGTSFIGECYSLPRRLSDFRHPKQGVATDHRIHDKIVEFGQAGLAVITGEHLADRNYRRQLKKQVSW